MMDIVPAGQDYADGDYNNCDRSDHGYDTGCPDDKVHTYDLCDGYSLGHKAEWNGLDGETPTQEPQSQVQVGFNPHTDGSNNTISIAPKQNQLQFSNRKTDSDYHDNNKYG